MKPQHTQGEWKIYETGTGITRIVDKDERILATVHGLLDGKNNPERILEAEANAQRIVTCVNEYEALKKKADMHDELVESVKVQLDIIKNLIASKRVVNLDEAISYYEQLLKQAGQK